MNGVFVILQRSFHVISLVAVRTLVQESARMQGLVSTQTARFGKRLSACFAVISRSFFMHVLLVTPNGMDDFTADVAFFPFRSVANLSLVSSDVPVVGFVRILLTAILTRVEFSIVLDVVQLVTAETDGGYHLVAYVTFYQFGFFFSKLVQVYVSLIYLFIVKGLAAMRADETLLIGRFFVISNFWRFLFQEGTQWSVRAD